MVYEEEKKDKISATGVTGTVLGGAALAFATGLLNGNGLFGNQNPANSPVYMLSQKDAQIAKLEAERYTDAETKALSKEVCDLKQRVAAIEVAEPLRERILQEQINCVTNTVNRLVQPMIPSINVSYPAPIPTVAIQSTTTPTSNSGSNG